MSYLEKYKENLNEQLDEDLIDTVEAGFMYGYESDGVEET